MSELNNESKRYYELAVKYTANKDYKLAIEPCKKLIELIPDYSKAWSLLGLVYEKLAENDKALECYEQALKRDSKDPDALRGIEKLAVFDLMGLICLKCGTKSPLSLYQHSELRSYGSIRIGYTHYTNSIKIPMCDNCIDDLSRWTSKHSTTKRTPVRSTMVIYTCIIFVLLIVGIPLLSTNFTAIWIFILLFIPVILYLIYLLYLYHLRNLDESPFRYIKIRGKLVYVRPKGRGSWKEYNEWINTLKMLPSFT